MGIRVQGPFSDLGWGWGLGIKISGLGWGLENKMETIIGFGAQGPEGEVEKKMETTVGFKVWSFKVLNGNRRNKKLNL